MVYFLSYSPKFLAHLLIDYTVHGVNSKFACRGWSIVGCMQEHGSSQACAEGAHHRHVHRRVQRVALFRLQAPRLSTSVFTELLRKWMSSSFCPHILAFEGDGTFLMLVVSHIFLTFFVTLSFLSDFPFFLVWN